MPGTITFKPIEANLNHDTDLIGKADPYCMFLVNGEKIKSQVCKSGGKHPIWEDAVTIPTGNQPTCFVELKDKDILKDDKLGSFEIDLQEIESQGRIKKWYPIFHKNRPAGEILMEAIYSPQGGYSQGMGGFVQGQGMPLHGQGLPLQGQGLPLHGQGLPLQGQGLPLQGQGIPLQSHGATILTSSIPVQSHTIHSQGMMGNQITQQTHQVHTHETLIAGPTMGQQQMNTIPSGQGYGYPVVGESLSEQYAREALIRGVDPLGTHLHQYPQQMMGAPSLVQGLHPIPQSNLGQPGAFLPNQLNPGVQQHLPGQVLSQNLPGQHLPGQINQNNIL